MSHSPALIQSILEQIQKDYPADQYSVATEKAIPGTRMFPDILIRDDEGNAMCAVEIGYTRPEKLTAYRDDLKIPDVRWYDKAGNLHADVRERVVKVTIEPCPSGRFVAYRIEEMVECHSEECEDTAYSELEDDEHPLFQDQGELACQVSDEMAAETTLLVVTDYNRAWFFVFCDRCGDTWSTSEEESVDVWAIAEELRTLSATEFARNWSARVWQGDWDGAVIFAKDYMAVELNYNDGEFLLPDSTRDYRKAVMAIRREASLASN